MASTLESLEKDAVSQEFVDILTKDPGCLKLSEEMEDMPEKILESLDTYKQDIRILSVNALGVEKDFTDILGILKRAATTPSTIRRDVLKLISRWEDLRQTYARLLWRSRDTAGAARVAADDFSRVFIKRVLLNRKVSMTRMKLEIEDYTSKLERDKRRAQELVDSFKHLQDDITAFRDDWSETVIRANAGQDTAIIKINEEITELDWKISTLQVKINELRESLSSRAAAVGGSWGLLACLCPSFWLRCGVLVVSAGAFYFKRRQLNSKITDIVKEREELRSLRERKQRDLQAISALSVGLVMSDDKFKDMLNRLGAFARIWGAIQADLHVIRGYLDEALRTADHDETSRQIFDDRIQMVFEQYVVLGKVFREYQIAVDPNSPIFKDFGREL